MRFSLSPKCATFIAIVLIFQVILTSLFSFFYKEISKENAYPLQSYNSWKKFYISMQDDCLNTSINEFSMEKLVNTLERRKTNPDTKCEKIMQDFNSIFEVSHRYSEPLSFPSLFMQRMQESLNPKLYETLFHQMLIHVFNRLTFESSAYNPLRSQRPRVKRAENIWKYVDKISKKTQKSCDFCNFNRQTALNELGRHETDFTVRISNSFKLEKWHGMIVTKGHHPTKLSFQELEMMMSEVVRWANEVETIDPAYIYPSAAWDVLYKAGASQIHPHIHITISPNHYYGSLEQYRSVAQTYFDQTKENLFSKLVEIYSSLGLAVRYGDAVALSTLVGRGDLEVMIISEKPSSDLFKLLYFTIKVYHDLDFPCYSLAMAWSSNRATYGKIPAIIRIMSRGDCLSEVNDISSLDLFLTNYRDHDPWLLVRHLRKKVASPSDLRN